MPQRPPSYYRQRKSPHKAAGEHRGKTLLGQDGRNWKSHPDTHGRYTWRKVPLRPTQSRQPIKRSHNRLNKSKQNEIKQNMTQFRRTNQRPASYYRERPSPHRPAGQHRGQTLPGHNDGLWRSQADINGRYMWRQVSPNKKLPAKSKKQINYRQRPSPHAPAGQHRGKTMHGHNGGMWTSKSDVNGRYAWRQG
jgi:hypothetical protein